MKHEPAAIIGAIVGVLEALLVVLALVFAWDERLVGPLVGLVAALGGFATRWFVKPAKASERGL